MNIVNNSGTFNGSQSLTNALTGSNYNTNSGIVTHAGLIPVV
jgi:hypothetical protein